MKRILSLVLVLALVLGSVPVAFAAEDTAGDMLKAAGFVAGDQDGNLNEDQPLTREQMMVLIAEMNGVKEEAATFGIPADFSDVNENDWFAPYVWYAFYQGWTAGMGDGSFGAGVAVDSRMAATFMLKALDYEVTDYNASVEQATDLGIEIASTASLTRGEGFKAMWSTVNLPKQGSDVALGVELGRIEAETTPVADFAGVIDAVDAVGATLIDVTFEDDVDAAAAEAATFVIVKKDTTDEVAVKSVMAVDSDRVAVELEALTAGAGYTVTVGESSKNFTAIAKETDAPKVSSVKGTDTDRVEVAFDMNIDRATAEDIANYSIDKIGTVTNAELKSDNATVVLTVEGFTKSLNVKMTVENVLNVDGVSMKKVTKTFYPKFDKSAPKIDKIETASNDVEVIVYFSDDHGVDEAVAEDVANYSIEGLDILEAKASKKDTAGKSIDFFKKVVLTTSEQQAGKKYELVVSYMVDGSTAKNATTKDLTEDFRGGKADTSKPSVTTVEALADNLVAVTFTDANDLDESTALDTANYTVDKDKLDVLDAAFKDDDADTKVVHLTVSDMEKGKSYKFLINNIADEFGNAITKDVAKYVSGTSNLERTSAATITKVESTSLTKVEVTFDVAVTSSAEDATNYVFNNDLGAATAAEFASGSNTKVILTVPSMTANKKYEVTVSGVENYFGYVAEDVAANFIATATSVDTTAPEIETISYENKGILKLEFSEEVRAGGSIVLERESDNTTQTKTAVYQTGDDDQTLVFDVTGLQAGETYIINSVTVYDVARNVADYTADAESFVTDADAYGNSDKIEFESWTQEDVKTVKFYFSDAVELAGYASTVDIAVASSKNSVTTITLEVDDDDAAVVIGTTNVSMKKDEVLAFNVTDMANAVTDFIGRPTMALEDNNTGSDSLGASHYEMEMTLEDDVKPIISEVFAVKNNEIHVFYDEDIATAGSYSLKDDDGNTVALGTPEVDGDDATLVVIKLSGSAELSSDKEYTLKQIGLARDIAGNTAEKEDDGYSFVGVDTEPAVEFKGVAVLAWDQAKFSDSSALTQTNDFYVSTTSVAANAAANKITADATPSSATTKSVTMSATNEYNAFLEGVTYYVFKDTATPTQVDSFEGIVDKLTGEFDTTTSAVTKMKSSSLVSGSSLMFYIVNVTDSTTATGTVTVDGEISITGVTPGANDVIRVMIKDGQNVTSYVEATVPAN